MHCFNPCLPCLKVFVFIFYAWSCNTVGQSEVSTPTSRLGISKCKVVSLTLESAAANSPTPFTFFQGHTLKETMLCPQAHDLCMLAVLHCGVLFFF